jgi:hypothetical protein
VEDKTFLGMIIPIKAQVHWGHAVSSHLHCESILVILSVHVPRVNVEEFIF